MFVFFENETYILGYGGAGTVQFLDDGTYYSDNFVTYSNYAIFQGDALPS